ncbi:hypothetical protein HMPREF0645_1777 [Hallella bergensis DSM 17361]|uniref:Copper resistance protein NlpE n=1 Tax=Hallella bergensis DSM 17361 TaxID=585502 RepID=D1PXU2_9BACT|nr:copper resistance protein NlpE N-terminal domain-containing protein [Hallella bergensis]EFA43763.1 hypothetical protein HMPREF0645_1777 [Hallella bergensis DSM 17361]
MKKTTFILFACAAIMAACNESKKATPVATEDTVAVDSVVYEGMTPAADCHGINYRLAMSQDSTMGFNLNQSYMKSETEVDTSFNYNGTAIAVTKTIDGKENNYFKLPLEENDTLFFMVLNDSTLRMVNAEFEEPVKTEGMSYDLKLVR